MTVTDERGNGISLMRARGRDAAKNRSWLILRIGHLMIAWTDRTQGQHDHVAGALVMRSGRSEQR